MKKLLSIFIIAITLLSTFSCGNNTPEAKDYFSEACKQLDKSSMGATSYSQAQIDEFEQRFAKMNLSGGFTKVTHYRSKDEYAYVIEFESADDATIFAERVSSPKYNVKAYDGVVVYGESSRIDSLK